MPYIRVYNGNTVVLRKVKPKLAVMDAKTEMGNGIEVAAPAKVVKPDAKAMRARLAAELFKSL